MDSSEEASTRRSIAIYDAVLLTITYVDITVQLYAIVVMLVATPEKMRQYRFFLLLYTVRPNALDLVQGWRILKTKPGPRPPKCTESLAFPGLTLKLGLTPICYEQRQPRKANVAFKLRSYVDLIRWHACSGNIVEVKTLLRKS